jgi:hypothetical protein
MPAPVNIPLEKLTAPPPDWAEKQKLWQELNERIRGSNPDFHPLTIKAAYVIGVIHQLCECVTYLLRAPDVSTFNRTHPWMIAHPAEHPWQTTYLPAYALFGAGIDLLGRCLRGNEGDTGSSEDLRTGFKWLKEPWYRTEGDIYDANRPETAYGYAHVSAEDVVISTTSHDYTVNQLAALRHYGAHGQAAAKLDFPEYNEVLPQMPPKLARALEAYWSLLVKESVPDVCNRLARANVVAFREQPIFTSWVVFEKGTDNKYRGVESIFREFNWRVA